MIGSLAYMLFAGTSAALPADVPVEHYEEAKHCHVVAMSVALLGSSKSNYLPDNSKYAREVADRYLPIIAFEAHKRGMDQKAIFEDLRSTYEAFSTKIIAQMNAGTKSNQMARYNEIVAEVRACAAVPDIAMASE